jgi:hypothetical protein
MKPLDKNKDEKYKSIEFNKKVGYDKFIKTTLKERRKQSNLN